MSKKKIIMILLLIGFILGIVFGIICIKNKANEVVGDIDTSENEEVLEITDNYFIEQTNDIFINTDDYIDKKIKIAGLIYSYTDYGTDQKYYAVVRNTPGCCGNDGLAGLDIRYDGEYPKDDQWVEIEGIIAKEVVKGEEIPTIIVTNIQESEKGVTFVTN